MTTSPQNRRDPASYPSKGERKQGASAAHKCSSAQVPKCPSSDNSGTQELSHSGTLRVVHIEARDCEVTPSPTGKSINVLLTGPGGVKMEFGFEVELGQRLRDQTQQSLAKLGAIRAALRRISGTQPLSHSGTGGQL